MTVTLLAIARSGSAQKKAVYDEAAQLAQKNANAFEADVQYRLSFAKTLAWTMEEYTTPDRAQVSRMLRNQLLKDPTIP